MARVVCVAVALVGWYVPVVAFQPASGIEALGSALARLRAAADQLSPDSFAAADAAPIEKRLDAAVRWLSNNYQPGAIADVSMDYAKAIDSAAQVLSNDPSPAQIEDVTLDLEAKVHFCRTTGQPMGGKVLVTVHTRSGQASVGEWRVHYLLKIFEVVGDASPGTFMRLSTPTMTHLEPGRYWVWARHPVTKRVTERVLVTLSGPTDAVVDLVVP